MPAKNPRLTITLEPAVHARLRRLSELTGNSQSAMVSDLLTGSQPIFDRTIRLLEAAASAKEEMRGKLSSDLAQAQAKLEGQLGLVLETMDDYTGDLLQESAVKRRARRGAKAVPSPASRVAPTPISNRGVRSKPKTSKTSMNSRG